MLAWTQSTETKSYYVVEKEGPSEGSLAYALPGVYIAVSGCVRAWARTARIFVLVLPPKQSVDLSSKSVCAASRAGIRMQRATAPTLQCAARLPSLPI